jgi:hypothetical protein
MVRHLLRITFLLAGLMALPIVLAASAEEKKDDTAKWTPLFNGKDLTGWKISPKANKKEIVEFIKKEQDGKLIAYYGKTPQGKEEPLWCVEDGVLIGSGPATHLFSERDDYQNFRYRVEAMINDRGNSGQFFRTRYEPGFPKGYEAQINSTHGDPIRSGSLYPSFRPSDEDKEKIIIKERLVQPNEWFTQEVIAQGNHIVIKVNGKTTVDYVDPKNTYTKGHFALQQHNLGSEVRFRKVEVIELPAEKKE